MRRRPLVKYTRYFHKEEPPKSIRKVLLGKYGKGDGIEYEDDEVRARLQDVPLGQVVYTDPKTGDYLIWKYVGNYWWCRKYKKSGKYEFARIVALQNDKSGTIVDLWDHRKHHTEIPPEIVYDDNKRGVIVGGNEWEVWVAWDREDGLPGPAVPVRDGSKLRFEFIEDYNKYKGILSKIRKSEGATGGST